MRKQKQPWITVLTITLAALLLITACAPSSPPPPPPPPPPPIPCEEAGDHIGERATVYGVVESTAYAFSSKGQPTFLNLGKPYPNQVFTVVIWGDNRNNFSYLPEIYYKYKTIYVTGLIEPYDGIPEIEVTSPDQIQIQ
jgi:hypothetical protein